MPVRVLHHHAGAATGRLIQDGHTVTVIYEIGVLKQGTFNWNAVVYVQYP